MRRIEHTTKATQGIRNNADEIFSDDFLKTERFQEYSKFLAEDGAVLAFLETGEADVHDASALQRADDEADRRAHAADLVFLAFGERDREFFLVENFYCGGLRVIALNVHAFFEFRRKVFGQFFFRRHNVFFFVLVVRIEEFIGDAAVVGEDNEPVRIFVEAAYREDADERDRLANVGFAFFG